MKNVMNMLMRAVVCVWAAGTMAQADTVLLTDNFEDGSIDSSKWTLITAAGHTGFDESSAGGVVTETGGYLWIQDKAGAYKSKLIPVNGQGELVITRSIYVSYSSSTLVSMPDEIVAEDGTVVFRWGYHNYSSGGTNRYGFGGFDDTLTPAQWGAFKNEIITYDPLTGEGTYSINGSAPVAVTGISLPNGTSNLYLRGSAYAVGSGTYYKAFQDFTVTQTDRSLLTVSSAYGSSVPTIGNSAYDTGSTVTCSVANVTIDGIDYECTGWSGTGSVPASGTTNEVIFTLSEDSSITWNWSVTLEDDFEDGVLNTSKWTAAMTTGSTTFNETAAGNSLTETNGLMNISDTVSGSGGAYKSAFLPVNEQGQIMINRRTKVHRSGSFLLIAFMTEQLKSEDGAVLMSWGYYSNMGINGFGGWNETLVPAVWDGWFDETITYDPITGYGSYSLNGGPPVLITGSAMPEGTANLYLLGGAYGEPGSTKQFDSFAVTQGDPVYLSALTVSSAYGSPSPSAGLALYDSGSVITCSVDSVITAAGNIRYRCSGWTGTGSVPVSGTTNEVVVTLNERSSITWNWELIDAVFTVNSAYGSPSPAAGSAVYEIGSAITCSVDDVVSGGTRHLCTGWAGTGSVPASGASNEVTFTLGETSSLTWNWETDHWLQVNISGGGSVGQTNGFYDADTVLSLTATPDEGWVFERWTGAATGSGSASIMLNEPKTVTAVFIYPAAVSNLNVAQVEGTRTAQVTYDLLADSPVFVDLAVYQGGSNLNVSAVTGSKGFIEPGTNRMITWDAGADWNLNADELTFSLTTEDGRPVYDPYQGGSVSLPRTGQTEGYGLEGTDGDLEPGLPWPEPRFTDHGNGTFTDNLTGLMWWSSYQSNRSWPSALYYAEDSTQGGYSDWRLPNVRELRSLFADYSYPFERTPGNYPTQHDFWTSTTEPAQPNGFGYNYKFIVNSGTGASEATRAWYYTNYRWDSYSQRYIYDTVYDLKYMTAVRSAAAGPAASPATGQTESYNSQYATEDGDLQNGISWPEPRFTDHGDGTATDNLTGLMWTTASSGQMNWDRARQSANALTLAGYEDWRLPSVNELESLVDYSIGRDAPSLPSGHPFTGISYASSSIHQYGYWSSTVYPASSSYAYGLQFYDGAIDAAPKTYTTTRYLACRGGVEASAETIEPVAQHRLAETGQTESYAANDDGAVRAGVASPNPRFADNGDGTIRDNLTGLRWYIAGSSSAQSWGFAVFTADWDDTGTDFRLPNIREMRSLMDLGQSETVWPEGHPFGSIQSNGVYWTSTSYYANGTDYAWMVDMSDGSSSASFKTTAGHYMLVSGPAYMSSVHVPITGQTHTYYGQDDGAAQAGYVETGDRFTDNGNYTVSDNRTGLMWLKSARVREPMSWGAAVQYCADLTFGGYTDWRLPNANELESLVDYSRGGSTTVLPEGHPFVDAARTGYWSSTTLIADTNQAFSVSLAAGSVDADSKNTPFIVWPVRGGN